MEKSDIRKAIKEAKKTLGKEAREEEARQCFLRLEEMDCYQRAKNILAYASLPDELPTGEFLQTASHSKRLFLPRVNGNDLDILPLDNCAVGAFGILEPIGDDVHSVKEMDLIIVPAVAFDRLGNRLGRGRGYYDRLLADAVCPKVGVAFSLQILDSLPTECHDIMMDAVVTATDIIAISEPLKL